MGRRGRILYRGGHRRGGGRRGAELLLYCCGHGDEEVELGRRGCCSGGEVIGRRPCGCSVVGSVKVEAGLFLDGWIDEE